MDYFLDKTGYSLLTKCISVVVLFTFLFNQLVVSAYAGPIPRKIDEPNNTGKIPIEEDINRQQTSHFVPTDTLYMEPSDKLSLEKIDISELTFEEKAAALENNDKFSDTKLFSYLTSLNIVFNTCGIAALSALLSLSNEKEIVLNTLVSDINNNNLYRIGDNIAYSLGALKDSAASFGYDLKAVQIDPYSITDILSYNDGIVAHTKEGHYKYVKFPFEIDPDTLTGYVLCENIAKVYKEIDKTSILNIYGTASWLDVQVNYNSVTADSDIENGVITDSDLIALLTGYIGIDLPNSSSQSSMLEDIKGTARRVNVSDNYVKGELENQAQYDSLLNDMIYLVSNDVDLDEDGIIDNKDEVNVLADAYLSILAYEFEAYSNDISLEYIKKDGDTYIFTAEVNNEYHKVRFDEDGNYICFVDSGGNAKDTTIEIIDPEDLSVLKTKTFTYTLADNILTETKSVSFDISSYSVTSKYDSNYNLIYYEDKQSEITSYTYDANNNLTSIIYSDGINEYFEYTYNGDEITKIVYLNTEYNNLIVTEYYDYEEGYIIKSRTGQGTYIDSSISYDGNALDDAKTIYSYFLEADILTQTGHIQYTDTQGSSIDYYVINKYDVDDNLINTTEKLSPSEYADQQVVDSKTTVYTYDADGDILSVIDGEGKGYRYEYVKDSQKRKLEIRALELEYGTVTVETYDVEGRLLTYNEGEGHWDDINGVVFIDLMSETPKVQNTYTDVSCFNEDEDGTWVKKTDLKGGLDFDGAGNYVEVAGSPSLNVTDTVTVEVWIKKTEQDYAHDTMLSTDSYRFQIDASNHVLWGWTDGAYNSSTNSAGTITLNEWNHIVGVKNGTNITFYLNGEEIGTGLVWHSRAVTSLLIGSDGISGIGGADNFDGSISEVRIYNRALNDGEVYSNYLGNVIQNGLILNHNYTRNHVRDLTDNNNDGSNFGAEYLSNFLEEAGSYNLETGLWTSSRMEAESVIYTENSDNIWSKEAAIIEGLAFDGNDYVKISNSPDLQINGDLALAFWIKAENIGSYRINPLDKSCGGEFALTIETDGRLSYYHGTQKASGYYWGWDAFDAGTLINGEWQFVVVTRDLETQTMKSYLNGQLMKEAVYSSDINKLPSISDYSVQVARGYTGHGYEGIMDGIGIYNRVLTDDEIVASYEGNVYKDGLVLQHD